MRALIVSVLAVSAVLFACALFGGCASGADGLRQGCADANQGLAGAFNLLTGDMKAAHDKGTAKQLLGCFSAASASLHTLVTAKDAVCCVVKNPDGTCSVPDNLPKQTLMDYAGKAAAIAPQIPAIISEWRACSVKALGASLNPLNGGK